MSLYEALDLLFTAIQVIIDIISRLLRKKKKKRKRIKK
jgi:ribosome-associated translation inhibitor RaiA